MTRKVLILIFGVFMSLTAGRSFGAINTVLDGNRHAALGAVCIQANDGDPWACWPGSGLLVSPQVVISVAHACPWLEGVKPAHTGFTFDEKITAPSKVYVVDQFICDPLFSATNTDSQDPHDLAVALLKEKVLGIRPFSLPPIVGFLDRGNVAFTYVTLVARGLSTLVGWPNFPVYGDRRYGTLVVTDLRPGAIMLAPDAKHPAQVCYGESGSAALFTNTNIAVAIGSWFSDWTAECQGPSGYTRLDTAQARDFLQLYLSSELLPK
jgi:hypothetical protein